MSQVTINAKAGSSGIRSAVDTWANARGASSGLSVPDSIGIQNRISGGSFQCARAFLNFDITSIPQGSRVSAVTLVHPAVSNFFNDESISLGVVDHTGSDPIVSGDYDQVTLNSDTTYATLAFSGLSTSTTTNITLDSNGIAVVQAAVNTRSLAKLALRGSLDLNNTQPVGNNEYVFSTTSAQLIITYTPPGAGILFAGI